MANWDERYRAGDHGSHEPHALVGQAAALFAPGRALDVACGTGRHALFLAKQGWQVTAVDSSVVAIELLSAQAQERGVAVATVVADLEQGDFTLAPNTYDLIVLTCYLQRDLFPALRTSVKPGGAIVAVIAMIDADPNVKPMNQDFLLATGELRAQFAGWELLHEAETKFAGRRAMAEIIARRPLE